jgi:hypothetical protein
LISPLKTDVEQQQSINTVSYISSVENIKKMRKSFFLAPARQVNPQTGLGWEPQATKKAGARQSSIWSLQAFLLNVNPVRFSRGHKLATINAVILWL